MKKNFFYVTMSAIALTSAIGFTACSSDDGAVADVNPTYDGESVKTQFSISLPSNLVKDTRMTASTVQAAENIESFRGMSGIVLIPYSSSTDRTARIGGNITLGQNKMIKPITTNEENAIPVGKLLANSNAVLYNDVTIPLATAGFLFYGEATGTEGFAEGSLTPAGLTGESSGISFTPTPILGWNTSANPIVPNVPTMTKGNALAAYVSSIAAASSDNGTPENTEDDIANIWARCANSENSTQSWYNAGLGQMYTAFTSVKAGSSFYIQAVVQDLYSSIKDNTDVVSVAIKKAILNSTYVTESGGTLTLKGDYSDYPANINMPEGAAALSWSTPATANDPKVASAVGGSNFGYSAMNVVNMTNIVYPASLYYYCNSGVKASNSSQQSLYNGTNTWTQITSNDAFTDNAVGPSTRSVAIINPIQYAVGRLDVNVEQLSSTAKYYDRGGNEMEIPANAFTLNGVLIGGQKSVDYNFEPSASASTEYVIYDKTINTSTDDPVISAVLSKTTAIGPTYTLALETVKDIPVYVALEFVNNSGKDFKGVDGIVKAGCKFYLVASLDPKADKTGEVSGVTSTGNKVFKQDFNTSAYFKIGVGTPDTNNDGVSDTPGGFANAYTTIPDLRTPQLELGFSVNLTWQAGIRFDVTF